MKSNHTYHIDPLAGEDSNDGLSPERPWRTYANREFAGGDTVLFKRGRVIRDSLHPRNGAEGAPITYGAYGEGDKPTFLGSVAAGDPDCWTEERANLWRYTGTFTSEVCNLVFNDGESCGVLRWRIEDLRQPGEWHYTGIGATSGGESWGEAGHQDGVLYLYSPVNPGAAYRSIECALWGQRKLVGGQRHLILEDLAFRNAGVHGYQDRQVEQVTIRRCEFCFIGGAVWNRDRRIRFGNAVELWDGARDVTVEGCRFDNIYDSGVTHQGGETRNIPERLYFRDNLFINCGLASYECREPSREVYFEHNTCIRAGGGFSMQGDMLPRQDNPYPQPVGYHVWAWLIEPHTQPGNVTIRHNIFCESDGAAICLTVDPADAQKFIVDHNGYWQTTGAPLIHVGGRSHVTNAKISICMDGQPYRPSEFNRYRAESGQDKHSQVAEPLFVDATRGDYRQREDSPCLSMGMRTDVGRIDSRRPGEHGSSWVRPEEMEFIHAWIRQLTDTKAQRDGAARHSEGTPFRFQCGTRCSREWVKREDATVERGDWLDGKRAHLLSWLDRETSIACEMEITEFRDFPAMEWVVRLRNDGAHETEPIHTFKALDVFWKCAKAGDMPELRRSLGSDGRHDDFQYQCDELRHSCWSIPRTIRMDSAHNGAFRKVRDGSPPGLVNDGRTSATWLPFFNLRTGGDGIIAALGWTGQWFAEFAHDGAGKTDISAGMEHLELKIQPGETIRSPRILLLYWQGEPLHAHNVLRQFILRFHSPQVDGKPVEMPICNGAWGGMPTQGHLDLIQAIHTHRLPYDYYWIDAGWYGTAREPCPDVFKGKWWLVGDWRVNPNYHPEGLKPIHDAARNADLKFLLWIEAEKAMHGTPVTLEHPEWFLRETQAEPRPNDQLLLNLGNADARHWIVETVSALIEEQGLDCYRVDFNLDPSPYWRNAEADGRKGIVELRFVEGLYAFWDELRRRHPHLLIDNCASGGRRLDLETIGRSVALWRADYTSSLNADALQAQSAGLNLWLPLNSTTPGANPDDPYAFRSALTAGLVLGDEFGVRQDWKTPDFPWECLRTRILEARRLRPCFYGDFYPLTPGTIHPDAWMAYQLALPGKGEGAVVVFRRAESPVVSVGFQLHDLRAEHDYEFEDADSGKKWIVTGSNLRTNGLEIAIATPRASRILFYKELTARA